MLRGAGGRVGGGGGGIGGGGGVGGGEHVSVRLTGGGPYGLRISAFDNGLHEQLIVAKLHKRSKARAAGVRVGDVVLSINGDRCQRMSPEAVNQLIDYSYDLTIQLLRHSDVDHIHHTTTSVTTTTSSFRHSPHPPFSASPSPSPDPFQSGSESSTIHRSTATELFRHKVRLHHIAEDEDPIADVARTSLSRTGQLETQREQPPAIKVTSHYGNEDSLPQQQQQRTKRVRWSGCGLETGGIDEVESGQESGATELAKDGLKGDGFSGWKKWTPTASTVAAAEAESDVEISTHSSLRQHFTTSTVAQPQPLPSFQPSQALPNKPKPLLWSPASSAVSHTESSGVESTKLPLNTTQPLQDSLDHEVVIWSSKTTEIEKSDGAAQKQLPWQQSKQAESKTSSVPLKEIVTPSLASSQKPNRWQPPTNQQTLGNIEGQDNASKLPAWQPPQPAVTIATDKTQPWQQPIPVVKEVDVLTNERSQPGRQHRWQPTQPPPPLHIDHQPTLDQTDHLEEPRGSLQQDGSSSPVVTSLFLTRVVTDGSDVMAGTGSDADTTLESAATQPRKLYGDSSFYEDPEHKYPTIVDQIKMARKVALLLTSPVNKNARGQRMFLKRKEQSSKWLIDTLNITVPRLFVSPPQPHSLYSLSDADHSNILSPNEVERMRYHEEKSRHDVIPFDVCSMLAAELREEKGRGGRLFAKRRDKADQSITPESNGLIRVQSPRPEQRSRFVPEVVVPIAAAPVVIPRAEQRSEVDGVNQPVPVNRLKDMVDLPKPRITPWDSAVQYGNVEPAFEHLKGFRSHAEEPASVAVVAVGPSSVLDHGGRSQGAFREGQGQVRGQSRDSNQSYGFRKDEVVEERRTTSYQSTYSEPKAISTGVAGFDGSTGFLRQASAKGKGHRPVHFDLGSRNFN